MKKVPLALVPLLSLVSIAMAAEGHQAFGPIRFGMTSEAFSRAQGHLVTETHREHTNLGNRLDKFTAAALRKYFVMNGTRFASHLAARDFSLSVVMVTKPLIPVTSGTTPLTEVCFQSENAPAGRYEFQTKGAWEILRDIGDSKLPRVGKPGVFPSIENLQVGDLVTDTWEGEGVRIELLVRNVVDPALPEPVYTAVLRATEISAPSTAAK